MAYYSQYGQDRWLFENIFTHKKDGVFLEIGADDGIDKSNTKFFEDLGWRGICIEPSFPRFQKLKANRNCICENVAISDSIGEVDFMDISGWGKGLSGIVSKYNTNHASRIDSELMHPENLGSTIVKVQTELLSNILDKHDVLSINLCSIDTEGSELDIIKSIDFTKYKFGVFLIENNYHDSRVYDHLLSNGYQLATKIAIDEVYTQKQL